MPGISHTWLYAWLPTRHNSQKQNCDESECRHASSMWTMRAIIRLELRVSWSWWAWLVDVGSLPLSQPAGYSYEEVRLTWTLQQINRRWPLQTAVPRSCAPAQKDSRGQAQSSNPCEIAHAHSKGSLAEAGESSALPNQASLSKNRMAIQIIILSNCCCLLALEGGGC